MARPARYNADYFTHTADLRNDRRVKAIRTKFGAAGYGLFHMLLEALTDADHTALDTSALELELLAGDFGVEASEIEALVTFGLAVGYFARNEAGLLVCAELSKWLEPVFEKRNRSKNPPAAALLPQPATETGVPVTETPQSKVKESKVKESKEEHTTSSLRSEDAASAAAPAPAEESQPAELPSQSPTPGLRTPGGAGDVATRKARPGKFEPPTEAEVLAYMAQHRPYNPPAEVQRLATKCFNYYRANGWKVGKNPMKDWGAACQTFLADLPKAKEGQPLNPHIQQHAVNRSSYSNASSAAAARLQTPTPDASSANAWGLPAYIPPSGAAGVGGGH